MLAPDDPRKNYANLVGGRVAARSAGAAARCARARRRRGAAGSLPRRRRLRVPVLLRGLRDPDPRGDGVAGRRSSPPRTPRSTRLPATQPSGSIPRAPRRSRRASSAPSASGTPRREGPRARAALHLAGLRRGSTSRIPDQHLRHFRRAARGSRHLAARPDASGHGPLCDQPAGRARAGRRRSRCARYSWGDGRPATKDRARHGLVSGRLAPAPRGETGSTSSTARRCARRSARGSRSSSRSTTWPCSATPRRSTAGRGRTARARCRGSPGRRRDRRRLAVRARRGARAARRRPRRRCA